MPPDKNDQQNLTYFQMAKLIYQARECLGWNIQDPKKLAQKISSLERGLPAEDEFIALISWLGNCRMVHKLDQDQHPLGSADSYQVPDLLAVFEYQGRLLPTLVEVKTTVNQKISWKPDYLERMKRYSDLLGLPLLVACKYRLQEMHTAYWTLFETGVFLKPHKNFQMPFDQAMKENLLGQLAGDFAVDIQAGVGIRFRVFPLGDKTKWEKAYYEQQAIFGKVETCYVDKDGNPIEADDRRLSPGSLAIIQCALLLSEYYSYITDTYIDFEWKLQRNQLIFAHQMFQMLLAYDLSVDEEIRWSNILRQGGFPVPSGDVHKAAEDESISGFILHQIPYTSPAPLQGQTSFVRW